MIDVERFYRFASFLPFALPVWALAFTAISGMLAGGKLPFAFSGLLFLFGFYGICAAIPYGIFLPIVWRFFRPSGEWQHRRVALVAPIVTAIPLGLLVAFVSSDWAGFGSPGFYVAAVGLGLGYSYVVLIEAALAVGKLSGWVTPSSG